MLCSKCGATNRDDALFCSNCGQSLKMDDTTLVNETKVEDSEVSNNCDNEVSQSIINESTQSTNNNDSLANTKVINDAPAKKSNVRKPGNSLLKILIPVIAVVIVVAIGCIYFFTKPIELNPYKNWTLVLDGYDGYAKAQLQIPEGQMSIDDVGYLALTKDEQKVAQNYYDYVLDLAIRVNKYSTELSALDGKYLEIAQQVSNLPSKYYSQEKLLDFSTKVLTADTSKRSDKELKQLIEDLVEYEQVFINSTNYCGLILPGGVENGKLSNGVVLQAGCKFNEKLEDLINVKPGEMIEYTVTGLPEANGIDPETVVSSAWLYNMYSQTYDLSVSINEDNLNGVSKDQFELKSYVSEDKPMVDISFNSSDGTLLLPTSDNVTCSSESSCTIDLTSAIGPKREEVTGNIRSLSTEEYDVVAELFYLQVNPLMDGIGWHIKEKGVDYLVTSYELDAYSSSWFDTYAQFIVHTEEGKDFTLQMSGKKLFKDSYGQYFLEGNDYTKLRGIVENNYIK